jgi:hypothetical protein
MVWPLLFMPVPPLSPRWWLIHTCFDAKQSRPPVMVRVTSSGGAMLGAKSSHFSWKHGKRRMPYVEALVLHLPQSTRPRFRLYHVSKHAHLKSHIHGYLHDNPSLPILEDHQDCSFRLWLLVQHLVVSVGHPNFRRSSRGAVGARRFFRDGS